VLLGGVILTVFVALLNTLTPSGRIAVVGLVVEVTPNVLGWRVSQAAGKPNLRSRSTTEPRTLGSAPPHRLLQSLDSELFHYVALVYRFA
jgi:hypothetical protein